MLVYTSLIGFKLGLSDNDSEYGVYIIHGENKDMKLNSSHTGLTAFLYATGLADL